MCVRARARVCVCVCVYVCMLRVTCQDNVNRLTVEAGGKTERKPMLLDDNDPLWDELRYMHMAKVRARLVRGWSKWICRP